MIKYDAQAIQVWHITYGKLCIRHSGEVDEVREGRLRRRERNRLR